MSLAPTRWLIGRGSRELPEGLFLHVFDDDGGDAWSPDQNRALRFASADDAERYGACLREAFHAVELPTALLSQPHEFDVEDDEDLAVG